MANIANMAKNSDPALKISVCNRVWHVGLLNGAQIKKKKITATTLKTGGGRTLTGKKTSIPVSRLLPAAQEGGGGFNIGESFSKIAESVTSIA